MAPDLLDLADRLWRREARPEDHHPVLGAVDAAEVAPGVLFVRAFGNVTVVDGGDGLALVDTGSAFTAAERHYLDTERRLARVATVGPDGIPHVTPVGWSLDGDVIEIRGHNLAATKKFRDVVRTGVAAVVIDDVLPDVGVSWYDDQAVCNITALSGETVNRNLHSNVGALATVSEAEDGTVTIRANGQLLPARLFPKDHAQLAPGAVFEHKHLDGVFDSIAAQLREASV